MLDVVLCSETVNELPVLKDKVEKNMANNKYSCLCFECIMDMLDYLNSAQSESLAVFLKTKEYSKGLQIATKINEICKKEKYCLVFVCDRIDDAEQLFYSGISYYMRDCIDASMERCFETLADYFQSDGRKILLLKNQNGMQPIAVGEISYIMSDKRKVVVATQAENISFYYKLDEVEAMLEKGFLRCHQSYLVNMDKIKSFVEDGLILENGDFVPVSRKKYYSAKRAYLSFVTGDKELITE